MSSATQPTRSLAAEHARWAAIVTQVIGDYIRSIDQPPVCPPATASELVPLFDWPLPDRPVPVDEIAEMLRRDVVANSTKISSPHYYGLFNPTPLPAAVWVDALCSALNQNSAAWRHAPAVSVLEAQVLRWLCDLLGLPAAAFGTLTSGGTEANLIGLKCARDACVPGVTVEGVASMGATLRVYASHQTHFSILKSADTLGIGRENVVTIDTDDTGRVENTKLRAQIERDLERSLRPCCVVGVAGATSTGAVDRLDELADLAYEYGLWLHVDAAYGGALAFSRANRHLLAGIERADSVTMDPHKWLSIPFGCGAVLVRNGPEALRNSFDVAPPYLDERRASDEDVDFDFFRLGQLGSRRANVLKLWVALCAMGRTGYEQVIDTQIELTRYLADELLGTGDFELVGEIQTAVCNLRYLPTTIRNASPEAQDAVQTAMQQQIEQAGRAWISTTVVAGRRTLRMNVNSVLTTRTDVDALVELLRSEGRRVVANVDVG